MGDFTQEKSSWERHCDVDDDDEGREIEGKGALKG